MNKSISIRYYMFAQNQTRLRRMHCFVSIANLKIVLGLSFAKAVASHWTCPALYVGTWALRSAGFAETAAIKLRRTHRNPSKQRVHIQLYLRKPIVVSAET